MDQRHVNEREWSNAANWHGGFLGIYASEEDTRWLVPKRRPGFGWTFNRAHPTARLLFALLIGGALWAMWVSRRP